MKDQLDLSVSIAVGSSIVSLLHCFLYDDAHVSVSKLLSWLFRKCSSYSTCSDTESWDKVYDHPWMDHGQATGFAIRPV